LRRIQLEVLAAARQYLPEFLQPIVRSLIESVNFVDTLVSRIETLFESFAINPPQEFMDVVRRVASAARPIPEIDVEVEFVVVDAVGGVVNHPSTDPPRYDGSVPSPDVTRRNTPGGRRDPRAGRLQPGVGDIF